MLSPINPDDVKKAFQANTAASLRAVEKISSSSRPTKALPESSSCEKKTCDDACCKPAEAGQATIEVRKVSPKG